MVKKQAKVNKRLYISKSFLEKRQESYENILSETGIKYRMNRSIQMEGAFDVLKNDYEFQEFLLRGKTKVKLEILLVCMGYNINKLHAKIQSVRHIHEEDRFPVCINLSCLLHLGRKSDERSQILPREYECMLAMCKVKGQVLYLLLRFRIMFPNLSRYLLPV